MNLQCLTRLIIQTVDNSRTLNEASDEEIQEKLESLLSVLEPMDLEKFAKWGTMQQQSKVEKCWVLSHRKSKN